MIARFAVFRLYQQRAFVAPSPARRNIARTSWHCKFWRLIVRPCAADHLGAPRGARLEWRRTADDLIRFMQTVKHDGQRFTDEQVTQFVRSRDITPGPAARSPVRVALRSWRAGPGPGQWGATTMVPAKQRALGDADAAGKTLIVAALLGQIRTRPPTRTAPILVVAFETSLVVHLQQDAAGKGENSQDASRAGRVVEVGGAGQKEAQ